jgi:hypothetical protein
MTDRRDPDPADPRRPDPVALIVDDHEIGVFPILVGVVLVLIAAYLFMPSA